MFLKVTLKDFLALYFDKLCLGFPRIKAQRTRIKVIERG